MTNVDTAKRLADTDRLAKLMCEEMGLNPFTYVVCNYGDDFTAYERRHYTAPSPPVQMTVNGQTHNLMTGQGVLTTSVEQWRLFRPHASQAVAYQLACHRFMLTEDQA